MKYLKSCLILVLAPLLVGCSKTLDLTYKSDPEAATLYAQNKNHGYTPVVVEYKLQPEDIARGFVMIDDASARWASGASAKLNKPLKVQLENAGFSGYSSEYTFMRPTDVAGNTIDAQFAELQRKLLAEKKHREALQRELSDIKGEIGNLRRSQNTAAFHDKHRPFGHEIGSAPY